MPNPLRLHKSVLILSPKADTEPQSFQLGRVATRVAFIQKRAPIFPVAYCAAFMTQDEIGRRLKEVTLWWYKRCSRIWLCVERGVRYPELDPLTHDVLLINEGMMVFPDGRRSFRDMGRIPVEQFRMPPADDEPADIHVLERSEVSHYLRCNMTSGLFRGMEA